MVKIKQRRSKQPNLEVLKYIKGGKSTKEKDGKHVYIVRDGKSREGRQYVRIKISVAHDVTWEDWYTPLRGHWIKKVEKYLKTCN